MEVHIKREPSAYPDGSVGMRIRRLEIRAKWMEEFELLETMADALAKFLIEKQAAEGKKKRKKGKGHA